MAFEAGGVNQKTYLKMFKVDKFFGVLCGNLMHMAKSIKLKGVC